jgi:hypothetical protein
MIEATIKLIHKICTIGVNTAYDFSRGGLRIFSQWLIEVLAEPASVFLASVQ